MWREREPICFDQMETSKELDWQPSTMRVGVGSANPVKVAATADALSDLVGVRVEAVPVESGVSEQPFGENETVAGALNRARAVLDEGDYDLGVGIEGGVAEMSGDAVPDELFLIMWAVVTDGSTIGYGSGPRMALPDAIATRIRGGEELGPVMDDVLGTENVAKKNGAAGALTGNAVTRESALSQAVAGALGPFVTDLYR